MTTFLADRYQVVKTRGAWRVIDQDGFAVSYTDYDTKREAVDAMRVCMDKRDDVERDGDGWPL